MIKLKTWISGIAIGTALCLSACNSGTGGEGGGTPITDADMIGIWAILSVHEKGTEKVTVPGQAPVTSNTDTTTTFTSGQATIEFKANKTVSMNVGFPITGTWSTSGSTLTMVTTVFGQADTSESTVTLDGKSATFVEREKTTETDEGMTYETDMTTTIKATKQ